MRPLHLCPLVALLFVLTACDPPAPKPGSAVEPSVPAKPSAPPPQPVPSITPKPKAVVSSGSTSITQLDRKSIDTTKLYNDILVDTTFEPIPSEDAASQDREDDSSYVLELKVRARIPEAARTLDQIKLNTPSLPDALPGLAPLLETANVSPAFEELYNRKVAFNLTRLTRLDTLLNRHNFYDCETILELQNGETGRRALLLQGDMDVNTDGSDGDRNFTVDGSSQFFQPQTSYRWKRLTDRPNPFLETTKRLLAEAEEEYKIVGLPMEKNRELEATIAHEKATLYEIDVYSFLISGADPFIVLPGFMIRDATGPFAPKIGDYAAVIYDDTIYPALLGDVGPSFKMGEASLRLTKHLNPKSSAYSRPVSSLEVSYLVFPGTAEATPGPPDLALWHAKVTDLLAELGLNPSKIHQWENVIAPWPTPTPTPSPTPIAMPTASASASATASPTASPTPIKPSATP